MPDICKKRVRLKRDADVDDMGVVGVRELRWFGSDWRG